MVSGLTAAFELHSYAGALKESPINLDIFWNFIFIEYNHTL